MENPSVAESKLLKACLGSHEPLDQLWCQNGTLAAVSDQLICLLANAGNWEGGVLGQPYTEFVRLSNGLATTSSKEQTLELHRGKVKLSLPISNLAEFVWPAFPRTKKTFTVPVHTVRDMIAAIDANGEGGLQVTRFEMLGFSIHNGIGYSLSMEAMIQLDAGFSPDISVVLPTPFLKQVAILLDISSMEDDENLNFFYTDKMIWTELARCRLGAALPVISSWLDTGKILEALKEGQEVSLSLSSLGEDLGLLASLSPVIKLSKTGLRCGAAHAWYEDSDIQLPEDCSLSVARLAAVLPLTPTLTYVAPRIVQLSGPHFEAFLTTAE